MLTTRQERFAAEYAVSGDEELAAIRAGYGERTARSTGRRLLRNEAVAEAVNVLREDAASHDMVTRQWVTARLKEVAERCMQVVPATPGKGRGEEGGEFRFDASNANRALSLLGKYLQMFSDKTDAKGGTHEESLDDLE
ncbi:phage terminase small subunit [Desulfobaculum xiamenense]|uniref:Phage terminase small subunit n=1 Tax=Desulfobaculum xiamenense TaxID=995050 RepID=A0A846QK55_9BACT|nr:terminase small subunit [Desulfobaculum xiamenense]NJB68521.1 phage terminase small subunit [Desulfobaculum xiamenense]